MAFACAHSWSYARVPKTTGDLWLPDPRPPDRLAESAARSNSFLLRVAPSTTSCRSPRLAARIFSSSRLSSSAADASDASRSSSVIVVVVFSVVVFVDVGAGGGGGAEAGAAGSSSSSTCATKMPGVGRSSSIGMATGMRSSPSSSATCSGGPTSATPSPSSSSSSSSSSGRSARFGARSASVFSLNVLSLSRTCHGSCSFARISSSSHSVIPSASILASSAASSLMNLYGSLFVRIPARSFSSASRLALATMSSNAALCRSRSLRSSSNILARSAFSSSTPPRSHAAARRLSFGNTGESSR